MKKIVWILLLCALLSGCAAGRTKITVHKKPVPAEETETVSTPVEKPLPEQREEKEPQPEETEKPVEKEEESVQAPAKETVETNNNLEADITQIREWYNQTQNNLGNLTATQTDSDTTEYKDADGNIKKMEVIKGDGHYEWYFFENDKLVFVYTENDGDEDRYYFKDDALIRWIDSYGNYHDGETQNVRYQVQNDKFVRNAYYMYR